MALHAPTDDAKQGLLNDEPVQHTAASSISEHKGDTRNQQQAYRMHRPEA
jgi:hypothetical protein